MISSFPLIEGACLCLLFSRCTECQDDSFGSDFYFGVNINAEIFVPEPESIQIHVTTASAVPVMFFVEDINSIIYNGTVAVNSSTTVSLDIKYIVANNSYSHRHKGLHLYTKNNNESVSALVVSYTNFSASSYRVYPLQTKGDNAVYTYYAMSSIKSTVYPSLDIHPHSLVLLVATTDNTTVTVTPTKRIYNMVEDVQSSSSNVDPLDANTSRNITLHRLQTLLFEVGMELSGTRVDSNKPLTVVSGHEYSTVPQSIENSGEGTSLHVPLVTSWGRTFLLAPHIGRRGGQYYNIIAVTSGTIVRYRCSNGNEASKLIDGVGSQLRFDLFTPQSAYCFLESDKPLLVAMLGIGAEEAENIGDPILSIVPSVDSYSQNDILFHVPYYRDIDSYYINIMSLAANPTVLLNGRVLSLNWTAIRNFGGEVAGYAAHMAISDVGVDYRMSSNAAITTMVYGWGPKISLGFTAGIEYNSGMYATGTTVVLFYCFNFLSLSGSNEEEINSTKDSSNNSSGAAIATGVTVSIVLLVVTAIVFVAIVTGLKVRAKRRLEQSN